MIHKLDKKNPPPACFGLLCRLFGSRRILGFRRRPFEFGFRIILGFQRILLVSEEYVLVSEYVFNQMDVNVSSISISPLVECCRSSPCRATKTSPPSRCAAKHNGPATQLDATCVAWHFQAGRWVQIIIGSSQ